MKGSRRGLTLVLALVLATAATAIVYTALAGRDDPTEAELAAVRAAAPTAPESAVVVAKRDLAAATLLTDEMVEIVQVPTSLTNEHLLSDPQQAVGKLTLVPLSKGEQLLDTRLADQPPPPETFAYEVPVGKRAFSLVYDEVMGAGALIQPGDKVDVLGYFILVPYDLESDSEPEEGQFLVNVETADLLAEPETEAEVVANVEQGAEVTVLGAEGRFFHVRVDDETGWIEAEAITVDPSNADEDGESQEYKKLPESHLVTYVVQDVEVLAVAQALTPEDAGVDGEATAPSPKPAPALAEGDGDEAAAEDDDNDGPVARPTAKSATLAVSPEQAQRLLLAINEKDVSIRLALRAPGDTTITSLPPVEMGVVPMGPSLSAVNTPQFPSDLVITEVAFTKRVLTTGEVLEFMATVKNVSDRTIVSGAEAPPEFTYVQGQAYDGLGFFPDPDTYRIGLNVAGAYPTPFPYRWSVGRDLEPGESTTIVGSVQLTEPVPDARYWLGVIREPGVVVQDGVGLTSISVLASEAVTVRATSASILAEPDTAAKVLQTVEQGARLDVGEGHGPWFRVQTGDIEGWIAADAVEAAAPAPTEDDLGTTAVPSQSAIERLQKRFNPWFEEEGR